MPPRAFGLEDWHLYKKKLCYGRSSQDSITQFYYAPKHSFSPPFAAKSVAPKPLGEPLSGSEV